MYTVASAQLPQPPAGADRIFIAPNAVIVLDGASAFARDAPDPTTYVDTLGAHLRSTIIEDQTIDLTTALARAIEATARTHSLYPGHSPSSTVAIARWTDTTVDLLVLGDSQITSPYGVLRDDRLDNIGVAERAAYRSRLREGHGFDDHHRALLAALQAQQARHRNKPHGYWIAESDPTSAGHALAQRHPTSRTPWLVLATDGAYRPLDHLGVEVPLPATDELLEDLLHECERWESESDPTGQLLPRSKQHDDKVIAVIQLKDRR